MKKISIAMGLLLSLSVALPGCSKSGETIDVPTADFNILSAENFLSVDGGKIEVLTDKSPREAYAQDSWLKVVQDGTRITLSAELNPKVESRNTLLVLKDNKGDSAVINIKQEGIIFGLPQEQAMIGGDATIDKTIQLASNISTTYTASESWITLKEEGKTLHISVAENTTGKPRSGFIVAKGGGLVDSLQVSQASLADIAGSYTQTALELEGTTMVERTSEVVIQRVTDTQAKFIIDGDLSWDVTFTPGVGLRMMNGRVAKTVTSGRNQTSYVISVLAADDFTYNHQNMIIGTREAVRLNIGKDGKLTFEEDQKLASDQRWASYGFVNSSSNRITQGTYTGINKVYIQPKLERK